MINPKRGGMRSSGIFFSGALWHALHALVSPGDGLSEVWAHHSINQRGFALPHPVVKIVEAPLSMLATEYLSLYSSVISATKQDRSRHWLFLMGIQG